MTRVLFAKGAEAVFVAQSGAAVIGGGPGGADADAAG